MNVYSTREQILLSAIRLFAQRGFDGVSMRQIASDVGIRGGSIYNHFTGKQDIIEQITAYLERYLVHYRMTADEIVKQLQTKTPMEILSRFITFYEKDDNDFPVMIHRLLHQEQFQNETIQAAADRFFLQEPADSLTYAMDVMVEANAIPPCDTRALAELWARTYLVYSMQAAHDISSVNYEEYKAMGEFFIRMATEGIRPIPVEHLRVVWIAGDPMDSGPDSQSSRTKDLILLKSLELFSDYGYQAVSIRQIANQVGIKGGSIYNHFTSKGEIMQEIINRLLEHYQEHTISNPVFESAMGSGNPDQIVLTLSSTYPPLTQDLVGKVYRVLFREQYHNEDLRDFWMGSLHKEIDLVAQVLERMCAQGRIPRNDFHMAAIAYAHAMSSLTLETTLYPSRSEQLHNIRLRIVSMLTALAAYGFGRSALSDRVYRDID